MHLSGEVQNAEVYALALGRRVQDAIEASAKFTDIANSTLLNLAAQLEDGIRVQVLALPKPGLKRPLQQQQLGPKVHNLHLS